ncbi:MAG: ATP-binding cassette domain-containing protein [Firmicutes bacterium]|nr:ATP-binding cassette domain-containing protein [Bacillota bacterium]
MARKTKSIYAGPQDEKIVISLRDVSKTYSKEAPAVSHANLDVREGEFVFVTGETGSGKSTLMKMLIRELKPSSGEVYVLGYDLNRIRHGKIPQFRRNIGVVFQDFRLLRDRNVFDNVAFAQHIIQVPGRKDIQKNVLFALDLVGLNDKYRRRTNELSGGEQQRVAIARAIVNKPYLLIADEPTGNLDADTAWDVMQCFDRINREFGTTILIVTHDRGIVSRMGRRVIEMKKGEIISDTGSETDFSGSYDGYAEENYQDVDADYNDVYSGGDPYQYDEEDDGY